MNITAYSSLFSLLLLFFLFGAKKLKLLCSFVGTFYLVQRRMQIRSFVLNQLKTTNPEYFYLVSPVSLSGEFMFGSFYILANLINTTGVYNNKRKT